MRAYSALRVVLLLAALAGLGANTALAQSEPAGVNPELLEDIRKSNAQCFACHSREGLANPPRTDMDLAKLHELLLDDADFKLSGHGQMACKTCHGPGFEAFPHVEGARAKISQCSECHAVKVMKVEKQYHAGVHTELADRFTCLSCHEPHLFNVAAKLEEPKAIVAQDNGMCLDCHDSEERFRAMAPADLKRPDIDAIHNWLPNHRLHWGAVRCIDCHTPAGKKLQPHEIVGKDKAERDCIACHTRETSLRVRLYRHRAEAEQERLGFANSVILSDSYVIGATRNRYVDWAVLGLAGVTLAGVAGHGTLRLLSALMRRRRR